MSLPEALPEILKVAAALLVVLAMILLLRFGYRPASRLSSRTSASGKLSLEATLFLDGRRKISLIGCRGASILILTGGPTDLLLGCTPAESACDAADVGMP